ncbi:hypothetical protein DFJ73DRAFT_849484 [Zopfochytrium polystomum]|nr:hypothetical protein DFJ73DRAFT_849484 [Zopfochytrium polystomum]
MRRGVFVVCGLLVSSSFSVVVEYSFGLFTVLFVFSIVSVPFHSARVLPLTHTHYLFLSRSRPWGWGWGKSKECLTSMRKGNYKQRLEEIDEIRKRDPTSQSYTIAVKG